MKTYIHIILYLCDQPERSVFFDQPTIIKDNNGVSIFECWAVVLIDTVWLMDETGNWHELSEEDQNADMVIETIWNRLNEKKEEAA